MNDLFSLKDKVIVVTGGTGVLGKSFVNGIVAADGTVVIIGRDINKANNLVEEIVNKGGKALAISADVLSESQMVVAREKIFLAFGKIDGLVNAAGGNVPEGVLQNSADIFDLNIQGMKNALELNVWGTLIPTQIFGSVMVKNGGGSIVNISSVSPKRALTKVLGYSMGKAAIDAYNQWFAVETANRFGDTIRMNALMPGFFLTEQNRTLLTNPDGSLTDRGNLILQNTPFKRFGNPDELIGALIYLLSDASKFVTGTQLSVDGGFSIFSGV
jgi:NAD(P)-dependent dehydrogenase (short-subunit alcohol dehydrogenase family)